jgi:transposase
MARFTSDEKLQAVKRYLSGNEGYKTVAQSIGVHPSVLLNWIKQYEFTGEAAFGKPYTTYTLKYKLDVLNYMNDQGTSFRETAAIFNISSHETLRKWKLAFETGGQDALKPMKKGRPTMNKNSKKPIPAEGSVEALQAELERLRMENAYLKKLNALVQNKEKSPNKTKRK